MVKMETFIFKKSTSTIINIAKSLPKIFNKKNKINIIGPRHGEKIHESLWSSERNDKSNKFKKYYRIPDLRNINHDIHNKKIIFLNINCHTHQKIQKYKWKEFIILLKNQKEIKEELII